MEEVQDKLRHLAQLPLETVVISAAVQDGGALGEVGGVGLKLRAVQARLGDGADLRVMGLHKPDGEEQKLDAENFVPGSPILRAKSAGDLLDQLIEHFGPHLYGRAQGLPSVLQSHNPRYQELRQRGWLNQRIREHIEQAQKEGQGGSYTVLTAPAFWGKSSFSVQWMRQSEGSGPLARPGENQPEQAWPLAGWSFIRQNDPDDRFRKGVPVLLGLEQSARLRLNLQLKPGAKLSFSSAHDDEKMHDHLNSFFADCAAWALKHKHPCILLLDAADEIWGQHGSEPNSLLPLPLPLPPQLPAGVHLVITSRPGEHLRWQGPRPQTLLWLHMGQQDTQQGLRGDATGLIQDYRQRWTDDKRYEAVQALDQLKPILLEKSENYLLYIRTVLDEDGTTWMLGKDQALSLEQRLKKFHLHPESLPQGARGLMAQTVFKFIEHPDSLERRRRAMLLGMAAELRDQSMTEAQLVELLIDEDDHFAVGAANIDKPERDWGAINARDLPRFEVVRQSLIALRACWADPDGENSSLSFSHLALRECAQAAWRLMPQWPSPPGGMTEQEQAQWVQQITQEIANPAPDSTQTRKLHHALARVSSRWWTNPEAARKHPKPQWQDDPGQRPGNPERYARVWGAWHALKSQEPQAAEMAAKVLVDARHLQEAYNAAPEQAGQALAESWELSRHRNQEPHQGQGEVDVFTSVLANTLNPRSERFASGKLQVAQECWNKLGGWEETKKRGLDRRWYDAATKGAWMAIEGGRPEPGIAVVEGFMVTYQKFILNPDGTPRWWVMAGGDECRIFDITQGPHVPRLMETHQLAMFGDHWAVCEAYDRSEPGRQAKLDGVWVGSVGADSGVRLLRMGEDGKIRRDVNGDPVGLVYWHERDDAQTFALLPLVNAESHADGCLLASGGTDGEVRLLRMGEDGKVRRDVNGDPAGLVYWHEGENNVRVLELLPALSANDMTDGYWLATGGNDGEVRLLRVDEDGMPRLNVAGGQGVALVQHASALVALALLPGRNAENHADGLWVASAAVDGEVRLLRVGEDGVPRHEVGGDPVQPVSREDGRASSLALLPAFKAGDQADGLWVGSVGADGEVRLLRVGEDGVSRHEVGGDPVQPMSRDEGGASSLALLPAFKAGGQADGLWMAFVGSHFEVRLLRVGGGGMPRKDVVGGRSVAFVHHASAPVALALLPRRNAENQADVLWVASVSKDGEVRLLRVDEDGKPRLDAAGRQGVALVQHASAPVALALLPGRNAENQADGLWVASAAKDGEVRLLRVGEDGKLCHEVADKVVAIDRNFYPFDAQRHSVFARDQAGVFWLARGIGCKVHLHRLGEYEKHQLEGDEVPVLAQHEGEVMAVALLPTLNVEGQAGGFWLASYGWLELRLLRVDEDGRPWVDEVGEPVMLQLSTGPIDRIVLGHDAPSIDKVHASVLVSIGFYDGSIRRYRVVFNHAAMAWDVQLLGQLAAPELGAMSPKQGYDFAWQLTENAIDQQRRTGLHAAYIGNKVLIGREIF